MMEEQAPNRVETGLECAARFNANHEVTSSKEWFINQKDIKLFKSAIVRAKVDENVRYLVYSVKRVVLTEKVDKPAKEVKRVRGVIQFFTPVEVDTVIKLVGENDHIPVPCERLVKTILYVHSNHNCIEKAAGFGKFKHPNDDDEFDRQGAYTATDVTEMEN